MKRLGLQQFLDGTEDLESVDLVIRAKAPVPPKLVENLRRLHALDLMTDEVVLSLIAQAPIDPFGIYGAMKNRGVWAFSPLDFTAVQVLAKKGSKPVAVMRIDLMSDDITFVALKENRLETFSQITAENIVAVIQQAASEEAVLAYINRHIQAAVEAGYADAA